MMKPLICYFVLGVVAGHGSSPSNLLVVNRGIAAGGTAGRSLGKSGGAGFLADRFAIGKRGDVWIIDTIRTWTAGDVRAEQAGLTDSFDQVSLFGGIEAPPPEPGRPPEPDCDCHNLMLIKRGRLAASGDVNISSAGIGVWQVEFRNLHWSIPGGVPVQFGVMGEPAGRRVWLNLASESDTGGRLNAFDRQGRFEGAYQLANTPSGSRLALNVQVWAHKMAEIAVRRVGTMLEVILQTTSFFDARSALAATARFGPANAVPVESRLQTAGGQAALILRFREAETGLPAGVASACLTGRQADGTPFEGCELVKEK